MKHSELSSIMSTEADQVKLQLFEMFKTKAWISILFSGSSISDYLDSLEEDNPKKRTVIIDGEKFNFQDLKLLINLAFISFSDLLEKYENENEPIDIEELNDYS